MLRPRASFVRAYTELSRLKCEIEKMGRQALVVPTDVSNFAQVRAMIDRAKDAFGRVDILVNNAWLDRQPSRARYRRG